jgi:hypothetical protein
MEGAVRSGLNAAIELRRGIGSLGGGPALGAGLHAGAAA